MALFLLWNWIVWEPDVRAMFSAIGFVVISTHIQGAAMTIADGPALADKREYPRFHCIKQIFFTTKDRFFEGTLENISRYGMGIKIADPLALDEIITVALPFTGGRQKKCKAQIVWMDTGRERFGLEFFRKRRAPELRIIR